MLRSGGNSPRISPLVRPVHDSESGSRLGESCDDGEFRDDTALLAESEFAQLDEVGKGRRQFMIVSGDSFAK